MKPRKGESRIGNRWWALFLVAAIVGGLVLTWATYNRHFSRRAEVTLTAERSGLMMEPGNVVKLRGVEVGRVAGIKGGSSPVSLKLELDPAQLEYIPANVEARITASTAFGPKYVELVVPSDPTPRRLAAGAVLRSENVSTEVNTVFENLVDLLDQVDPAKLNAVLSAFAEGLRGKGETIGQAITDSTRVLGALNDRNDVITQDLRSFTGFNQAYAGAAPDLISTLDALATTSRTITDHKDDLDGLLLSAIGLGNTGTEVIGTNRDKLIDTINLLEPTTALLMKYNPTYTCLLVGAKWYLDNGAYAATSNGYSVITDTGLLLGNDPYVYPDNLPVVGAKGGPGGKPSCGSLPDATKNFPVRQLVMNTGWGTGIDLRPNSGLGHPCFGNYFPVTRAVPERDTYRCVGPPSPGLVVPPTGPLPFADAIPQPAPPPPGPPGP